ELRSLRHRLWSANNDRAKATMRLMVVVLMGAAFAAAPGQWMASDSSAADEKTKVVLGTATPGGGFPLYGGVVAEVVNAADPTLSIEPTNTMGSTENVPLL